MNICVMEMYRLPPFEIDKKAMRNSLIRFGKRDNFYNQNTQSKYEDLEKAKKISVDHTNNLGMTYYFLDMTNKM